MELQRCNIPDTFVGGAAIYQAFNCEVKHNGLIHDWTCLDTPLDVLGRVWMCLDVFGRVETLLDVTFGHTLQAYTFKNKTEKVLTWI